MDEEMVLLLKLMLAQAEKPDGKKSKPSDLLSSLDFDPSEKRKAGKGLSDKTQEEDPTEEIREEFLANNPLPPARKEVPIWEKYALTTAEAALYYHIGYNKLRTLVHNNEKADYLFWIGQRVFIKRKKFEDFLNATNVI